MNSLLPLAPFGRRLSHLVCYALLAAVFAAPLPAAEDTTLAVPSGMTTRGVPAIDASSLAALQPYQNTRAAGFEDWHPSERKLLIGTRFADARQLHEVAFPGGARSQITFFAEPVADGLYRPDRPQQIAFTRDVGGNENYQIYLLDRATGGVRLLTDGTHRHEGLRWSPDGRWLAYTGNARNGQDSDLYVVDPDSGAERRVAELSGQWYVLDWSPDSKQVLILNFISVSESSLHAIDVASGTRRALTPTEGEPAAYSSARWSTDGASIYLVTDRGSQFARLVRLDLDTNLSTTLSGQIDWEVEDFDLSSDGSLIAFLTNEDGGSRLHLLEAGSGRELPPPELPLGVASSPRFRPGSHEVAFSLSWARSTTDVYSYDPAAGRLHRWTESEVGGLDPSRFAVPELVRFPTFDHLPGAGAREVGPQRTIPAFVYRPDPRRFPGPRPVLINIHGGPEGQSRPRFLGPTNYYLDELGFALVLPNVRGSTGYGRDFHQLDNGRNREDSVKDIGSLLDWIATQGDLDATRVVVMGGSYGGYMVLASMVAYADRLAAGFDSVGISNFVTFLTETQDYRRDLRRVEYGDEREPAMREFLNRISPLTRVAEIKKPLLVSQGANDPRVPLNESTQLVDALAARGVPVWYLVAADEGHGFRKKGNADYQTAVFIEFLRRFVLTPPAAGRT